MKIVFIGDVVGKAGCEAFARLMPRIREMYAPDFVIVNGENSAEGNGVTPDSAEELFCAGADLLTGGNHSLRRKEIHGYMERNDLLLRPANFHSSCPGQGMALLTRGKHRLYVMNLAGRVYCDPCDSPFDCADRLLAGCEKGVPVLVDFHAEATSEKKGMGYYLDGRVAALFGTHTHVQTNDLTLLPKGTAYLTDAGMTGVKDSILGVETGCALRKLRTGMPVRFESAKGSCILGGVFLELSEAGKPIAAELVSLER